METFIVYDGTATAQILIEPEAYEGVRRIAGRVARDIELVTGVRPEVSGAVPGSEDASGAAQMPAQGGREAADSASCTPVIVGATLGHSPLLDRWQQEGKWDGAAIAGRREVYQIGIVEQPFAENPAVGRALVVAGSDKRGTIYGLFRISELCGVSSLVYWGDVQPEKKERLELELGEPIVSEEPSVRYRGFFINDEWPAFGNWAKERFGGINAAAYEEVFIFLLRMKGNYLWPAMWNSTFSEDGPGLANAELADLYGVIIGLSHHEPMCRAGMEWQNIYRQYGDDNTWSFVTNREAITEFWKDGLLRNRRFENLITVGMRGENDSELLPRDATMADNVQVVKDAILTQHRLIRECVDEDLSRVPRMLAIYKEVEKFYYGDDTCAGLKDWEELDDVILMLCDDNFGNTRALPSKGDRPHPGGYGMYYHFDYHGAPVSYEWQNSSRLVKTWEQMTMAYENGVRELWIVNVGDIKGVEYPLTYFMELAYDYGKWSRRNAVEEFVRGWIDRQFGGRLTAAQKERLLMLLHGWTRWSAARRPEAMNPAVYDPCHFREGDRVRTEAGRLMEEAKELREQMPEDCRGAYESMVYYPLTATFNLILMHVEAGLNAHYAKRGSLMANTYADSVRKRIRMDADYVSAYHKMLGGKWNHMMDSAHTGFRSWDANNWTYPTVQEVIPIRREKIVAGFCGSEKYHLGTHWQDSGPLVNTEFTRPDTEEILIDLGSRGDVDFSWEVHCDQPWLSFSPERGYVQALKDGGAVIAVTCDRTRLSGRQSALAEIRVKFANGACTQSRFRIEAGAAPADPELPAGTFVAHEGVIAMEASHFAAAHDVDGEGFRAVDSLGRMGDAVRTFPMTAGWEPGGEAPWLRYDFAADEAGRYKVQFWLSPHNPAQAGGRIPCGYSVNDGEKTILPTVSKSIYTEYSCSEWNRGVMNNIRIVEAEVELTGGLNRLYVYGGDPGIVLERIVLYPAGKPLPHSYLGPQESWRV